MRLLISLCLFFIVTAAFSQNDKERFEKYVEKYSDGKQLSSDSWLITLEEDTVSFASTGENGC